MKMIIVGLVSLVGVPSIANAQAVKSVVTASNGIQVTVYSDEFANRYEYSSPYVDLGDGKVMVATVKKAGKAQAIDLSGFFVYSGEWRRYNSALFKGGDAAKFVSTGRDVGRCSSSRYSRPSCTLTESFVIAVTPAEIRAHDDGGVVAIQVRAEDTSTAIAQVPVGYFKAVAEVAGISIDPPVIAAPPIPAAQASRPIRPVVRRTPSSRTRKR